MLVYLLIIVGLMFRIIPHAPNIAPIAAIALFAGTYLNRKIVPWVPLVIMIISDLIIGLHNVVFFTWGAFILVGYIGCWLKDNKNPKNIIGAAVLSAILFFFITNMGVALVWYPHTFNGILSCFIKAIPFFRNTLISNLIFTIAFFGLYELALKASGKKELPSILFAK